MQALSHGVYSARLATKAQDVAAAQSLRLLRFRTARGLPQIANDSDRFDALCAHVLVTHAPTDAVVACFRVLQFDNGAQVAASYAAQFYDLAPLRGVARPVLELGRFCLHPDHSDPDILRLAWAALTRLVVQGDVSMIFGCSSFDGADPALHRTALAFLARNHLGPPALRPAAKAPERVSLAAHAFDAPMIPPALPSLLRTYLGMGGWVSDHAVMDRDLNTLHVFTALDVAAVPASRARALRALAT